MERVFIIHGFNSQPNRAWRPWLMRELAKEDIYACALPMPGGDHPQCDKWIETIERATEGIYGVYLVGHSLGARAVLRYLEQLNDKIKGVILVAGRYEKAISGIGGSFYDDPLDFSKIKASCNNFAVIHGDDDPIVPYEDGKKLAENLKCKLITIQGGGHLSGKAQQYELPEVRDILLTWIKK